VVTGCHVKGWVDAWRRSRKVLQTCTDPLAAGPSVAGASAGQAGMRFKIVRPAAVTDAARRNPLRELFDMCAVSFSSPGRELLEFRQTSTRYRNNNRLSTGYCGGIADGGLIT